MSTHFADRLAAAIDARGTPAVVGIDPVFDSLPAPLRNGPRSLAADLAAVEEFCAGVIGVVGHVVPAVKINAGFFEAYYAAGMAVYYRLVAAAHRRGLLVIGDIKRGDIGNTAERYARGHLASPTYADVDAASIPDAVTLSGYLGANAVRPFVEIARATGRGIYVLVRPSDPGADEVHDFGGPTPFYLHMAALVDRWGGAAELLGTCGLSCVGAVVAPKDEASTAALRATLPRTPLLVPGYGAQGATAESCRPCFLSGGGGAIVNASRSVIYAFASPRYADQHGTDWLMCVEHAARDFAREIAAVARR